GADQAAASGFPSRCVGGRFLLDRVPRIHSVRRQAFAARAEDPAQRYRSAADGGWRKSPDPLWLCSLRGRDEGRRRPSAGNRAQPRRGRGSRRGGRPCQPAGATASRLTVRQSRRCAPLRRTAPLHLRLRPRDQLDRDDQGNPHPLGAAADLGRRAEGHIPRAPALQRGLPQARQRLSRRERALSLGAGRGGETQGGGMNLAVERAPRGPFDGVLQIVRYNWNLYVAAILVAALVVGLVLVIRPPAVLAGLLILGAIAA